MTYINQQVKLRKSQSLFITIHKNTSTMAVEARTKFFFLKSVEYETNCAKYSHAQNKQSTHERENGPWAPEITIN